MTQSWISFHIGMLRVEFLWKLDYWALNFNLNWFAASRIRISIQTIHNDAKSNLDSTLVCRELNFDLNWLAASWIYI